MGYNDIRYNQNTHGQCRVINYKTGEVYVDPRKEYEMIQKQREERRYVREQQSIEQERREYIKLKKKRKFAVRVISALTITALAFGIHFADTKNEMVEQSGGTRITNYSTGTVQYEGVDISNKAVMDKILNDIQNKIEYVEDKLDFNELGKGM